MKKIWQCCFALACLLLAQPAGATNIKELKSAKGVVAWMVEDPSLPILSLHLVFKHAGSAYDPKGKEGTASLLSAMLTEGAGELDSRAFNAYLEERGIKFSVTADQDNIYISIKTLAKHVDEACEVLQKVLETPRFDQADIDLLKKQMLTSLVARREDPKWVAKQAFQMQLFAGHPYANNDFGNETSLAALTRDDLMAFLKQRLTLDALSVAVVGDVKPATFITVLDTHLGRLPQTQGSGVTVKEYTDYPAGSETVLNMDVPQSVAMFGHKGIKRDDPDFYAAYVLNYVLGSGNFSSRLMETVREEKGLAYSIYTSLDMLEYAGIFTGSVATRNDSIHESMELTKKEIARLKDKGVTEKELQAAKQYITGSFPLMLDKNEKLAQYLISMQVQNLGKDYLDKRNSYIEAVTLADINRVARTLFSPENLVTVIVGKKGEMKPPKKGD